MGRRDQRTLILFFKGTSVRQETWRTKKGGERRERTLRDVRVHEKHRKRQIVAGAQLPVQHSIRHLLESIKLENLVMNELTKMTLAASWIRFQPGRVSSIFHFKLHCLSIIHTLGFITLDSFHAIRRLFFLIDECIPLSKVKCFHHATHTVSERYISCKNVRDQGRSVPK